MAVKYLKISKSDSVALIELIKVEQSVLKEAIKVSRRMGFHTNKVVVSSGFFGSGVVGFTSRKGQEVDRKTWYLDKNHPECWRPYRNRLNKGLTKAFASWKYDVSGAVCNALGLKTWIGGTVYSAGCFVADGHVFVAYVPKMGEPSLGRQISKATYDKWEARDVG